MFGVDVKLMGFVALIISCAAAIVDGKSPVAPDLSVGVLPELFVHGDHFSVHLLLLHPSIPHQNIIFCQCISRYFSNNPLLLMVLMNFSRKL